MNPSIDVSTSTGEVVPTRKLRCSEVRRDPGGGGINVARVVRRLGMACRAFYPAGGSNARLLNRLLEREGVDVIPVEIEEETRESLSVLEESSGQQYRFVLPGPRLTADETDACLERLASLPESPDIVVVSGSLPPGLPDDFYARIIRVCRAHGARVVLDSSGPALARALDAGVYLVKPNLRELQSLAGGGLTREDQWSAAATELVRSGKADVVALTLGDRGAMLVSRDGVVSAPPVPVEIESAIGAGDSFLAAIVWRIASGGGLEDAFRYGVAAGTAALLTPGTELCHKDDVERLYHEVRLEPLADSPASSS